MRDDKGQSPLDNAVNNDDGHVDVALYLMSRGCDGDEVKAKLLCRACRSGRLGVVKEVVEHYKVDPKSECDDFVLCNISNTTYSQVKKPVEVTVRHSMLT